MTHRGTVVVAAAVVALAATVGTGGFSTTVADRPVSIDVADDANAALGVDVSYVTHTTSQTQEPTSAGTTTGTDTGTQTATRTGTEPATSDQETAASSSLTVTITNRFPDGTALTAVTVDYGDRTRTLATPTDPLEPGDSATTTFQDATCGDTVHVDGRSDSMTVVLERNASCDDTTD
ncbi:hypothetical protein G9C85_02885 [Halorubellus sp. JP-L1]|uniref:hypothetical protein n=1 Tax=Halorubellus sp. JP-L1 TaxID=2715753 RepID=UPI00140A9284|nr:hypothetical protein [Halorubellus sp. JP-L1]NHN40583.1 hypothetical protein [Halorubellus sp. JP-L1]